MLIKCFLLCVGDLPLSCDFSICTCCHGYKILGDSYFMFCVLDLP